MTTLPSFIAISSSIQKGKMISSYFLLILAASFLCEGCDSLRQHRIINMDFDIEEAPWQVSLQINGEHHCGGTIYSKRIVITAASCLYQVGMFGNLFVNDKRLIIVAGSELKRSRKGLYAVSAKRHHEKFTMDSNLTGAPYDIAIIKLSKPFRISNQVMPINLATDNPAQGSLVLSTGWGQINTKSHPMFPENLQGLPIFIQNFDRCKKGMPWLTKANICGFPGLPTHSICGGDSGGPLVFNNTLVGVVAAASKDCSGYVAYSSVAHHHKWLLDAIKTI